MEGWSAGVPWEGIPLLDLLRQAGMSLTNINHVTITAITGYSTTLSSDEVANLDFMIALKAGGAPLTVDHGYPARLVMPTRVRRRSGEVCRQDNGNKHLIEGRELRSPPHL